MYNQKMSLGAGALQVYGGRQQFWHREGGVHGHPATSQQNTYQNPMLTNGKVERKKRSVKSAGYIARPFFKAS